MNISFSGVKNVGALQTNQIVVRQRGFQDGYLDSENCEYVEVPHYINVNLQLTNNNGNDLDSFKSILEKYPNRINKNFLSLNMQLQDFISIPNILKLMMKTYIYLKN